MSKNNPYQSPLPTAPNDPAQRPWKGGCRSTLVNSGLLHRKVLIQNPIEVTIEYFARGLLDKIMVNGLTVISRLPIIRLTEQFDFEIPYCDGTLPTIVRLKTGRRSVKIISFQIEIDGILAYDERDGQQRRGNESV